MAYDSFDKVVLLFGGCRNSCGTAETFNDTWTYAHGRWNELATKVAPSARSGAGMVYDATDSYVLLFGGFDGGSTYFNDTWSFHNGTWTPIRTNSSPSARQPGGIVFVPKGGGRVLLFGGAHPLFHGAHPSMMNDTWTYLRGTWTENRLVHHPSPRTAAMMAFDWVDGAAVLFGGMGLRNNFLNDSWEFINGSWTALTTVGGVPPSAAGSLSSAGPDSPDVLFGGNSSNGALADTWTLRIRGLDALWTAQSTQVAPTDRYSSGFAFDGADRHLIMFGGQDCPNPLTCGFSFGDTWSYLNGTWNLLSSNAPPPRAQARMAWDGGDRYVLLFGGCSGECQAPGTVYNDTWTFANGSWTRLSPSLSPPARRDPGMTYDAVDGYVVLFGGTGGPGPYLRDTWTFQRGNWSLVTTGRGLNNTLYPSARRPALMVYDLADSYVVMFGGQTSGGLIHNDTWTFRAGNWTPLSTQGPPIRELTGSVYDSVDGYVLMFGGWGAPQNIGYWGALNETWEFLGGNWTELFPRVVPPNLADPAMAYDPSSRSIVLQGGADFSGFPVSETWEWVGGNWTQVHTKLKLPASYGAAFVEDPDSSSALLFGGQDSVFGVAQHRSFGTTWSYSSGSWSSV